MANEEITTTEAEKPKRGRDKRERRGDDRPAEKSPTLSALSSSTA